MAKRKDHTTRRPKALSGDEVKTGIEFMILLEQTDYEITDWDKNSVELKYPDGVKQWMPDHKAANVLTMAIRH